MFSLSPCCPSPLPPMPYLCIFLYSVCFSAFLRLFNFVFSDSYLSKVSWQRAWQIEYPRSFSPDGSAYLSFQSSLMTRCGGVVRILSLCTFDLQKYVTVPVTAASGSRSSRTPKSNDGVELFSHAPLNSLKALSAPLGSAAPHLPTY